MDSDFETLIGIIRFLQTPRALRRKIEGMPQLTQEQTLVLFAAKIVKVLLDMKVAMAAKGIFIEDKTEGGIIKPA